MQDDDEDAEHPEEDLSEKMQNDMLWEIGNVCDMCMAPNQAVQQAETDMAYYDENTWEELDGELVKAAEQDEMRRFQKMGVYTYTSREAAEKDAGGKFVRVKWVRVNKGSAAAPKIRCRLVAQELAYGQRMDELFAGTPALACVRVALSHAAKGGGVPGAHLGRQMRTPVWQDKPTSLH